LRRFEAELMDERQGGAQSGSRRWAAQQPTTIEGITAAWQEASEALRDSERRYRDLVEYSLGLICSHDLNGTLLSINPAAAESLGYRPEHGVGHNLREFLSADTRHLFDDYLLRIKEHGHDAGLMRVVARNGVERVWMYRNVLSQGVSDAYVLGHAIDITDRVSAERTLRQSEQELRRAHIELEERVQQRTAALAFLAQLSDRLSQVLTFDALIDVVRLLPVPFLADWTMVHVLDEDGVVRYVPGVHVDEAQQALLANTSEPVTTVDPGSHLGQVLASGRTARIDLTTESASAVKCGGAVTVNTPGALIARTAMMLPLIVNGTTRGVLSLMSIGGRDLSPSDSLVIEEVTRRITLSLERIQLYREAQEANRLKDEFLGTLSHELRTPLNAIFGWARILRGRQLDEKTAHGIEVIERNAEAQVRLIEEVLDVSRIIRGKMTLAPGPVDLPSIVTATIESVRPTLQAKRLRLDVQIEPLLTIVGDKHRLQQVFWNLLSNALKFTPSDGAVGVTLRRRGALVEFEITDSGAGIRRDVLPYIFDRFRQADSSTTRTYGGLGLGLAIVKHIVDLHGGKVRAASPGEGLGATFTIELPAGQPLTGAPAPVEKRPAATVPSSALRNRTVLVVEDHDDARELIVGVLEFAGARVLAAATATEGIARAMEVRPDVLVTDLGLPGEDGYLLLARLREMFPDLPALALTAFAGAADRERVLAAGFQQHVVKPVDPEELVHVIAAVL
jgi:PAS domain S-box-containing protein